MSKGNINYQLPGQIMNPTSSVCVNPKCDMGRPHYKDIGKPSKEICRFCGKQTLVEIRGEPRD